MRVRSWTIDGAESLPRLDSGDLPGGLVVVYGGDAQRKDAAIAMIRRVLFSTPNGGDAHTAVLLSGANGEFELAANGAPDSETLRRLDGAPAELAELGRLFGRAERGDLRRAFDVADGSAVDPSEAFDTRLLLPHSRVATADIRVRMTELLGDQAGGEIATLLDELETLRGPLAEAVAWEASYAERQAAERAATDRVGHLCGELADLRKRRERIKVYLAVWPAWLDYQRADGRLAELEEIDDFPEPEMSIDEAQTAAADAETQLQEIRKAHRQARAELDSLPASSDRHRVVDQVEAICAELPAYRQQMTAFARARARSDELAGLSRELGNRVAGDAGGATFDPTHLDLEAARDWLSRSDSLADRETMTRASLERTRSAIKQLRNERQRAIRAAKSLSVRLDDCDEHWRALWSLRDDLEQLWEIQSQGEAAARTAEQRLETLRGMEGQRRGRPPSPMLTKLSWTVAAGAFVGALWKTRQEDEQMTLVFAGVVVAAVALQLLVGWRWRLAQVRNRDMTARHERLRYDLERSRQLRDSRWRSAAEIARRIEAAAVALGLSPEPSIEEVEAAEESLFAATRKLHERGPLAETALAFHDYRDEEELLMAQLREIHQARDSAALEWEEWKSSVGLPTWLAQDDLTTYLCELDRWREIEDEMQEVDAQLRELAPAIEAWEAKARAVLVGVGVDSDPSICGRDLEDQLTTLRESARRSRHVLARRAELSDRIAELDLELSAAESAATASAGAFEALRRAAGTADPEEFARRREVFRTRRALHGERAAAESELARLLVEHRLEDGAATRADLAAGDTDTWTAEAGDIDAAVERLEAELEATSHARSVAAAACREIEQSTRVATLRQEQACLVEELRRRADEWRCLALAEGLIEHAARSLSETTGLLAAASEILGRLTGGEIARLTLSNDADHLAIVDHRGEQHAVDGDLSPALRRLVHLSLQLSMARDLSRDAEPIPVVMDEVLRDLDERQAAATAVEIAALAEQHQVLYFTTEQASVEALRAAGSVSHVLTV